MKSGGPGEAHSRAILAELMDGATEIAGGWSAADLRGVLQHQLRTPVAAESEAMTDPSAPARFDTEVTAGRDRDETFFDVLARGDPADGALLFVKSYAKRALSASDALPHPVAHFLYVASIVRARAAGDEGFSSLSPAMVEAEARRCLTQPWLPDEARELLREGLAS